MKPCVILCAGCLKPMATASRVLRALRRTSMRTSRSPIPNNATVIVDASRADFVDPDVRELIDKFVVDAPERGIHVECRQLERVARERPGLQQRLAFFRRASIK